jgi:hypothetical protein
LSQRKFQPDLSQQQDLAFSGSRVENRPSRHEINQNLLQETAEKKTTIQEKFRIQLDKRKPHNKPILAQLLRFSDDPVKISD